MHIHTEAKQMDSEIEMADDATSYSWAVDSAIRSETASILGESRVHSFASLVDSAIRSETSSILGTSPVHSFAEDNVMRLGQSEDMMSLNRIFRSMGLSWPEDFVIPAAAWEEAQARNQKQREGVLAPLSQAQQQMVEEASAALVDFHNLSTNGNGNGSFSFRSWQKGEFLGKGSFGTVYEGFTDDGYFFAVKEVSLLDVRSQDKLSIFQLQREISPLSQFRHDNIVRYLGTDKDNDKLYIFLELVTKGSVASLYQKYRLRDSQVSAYTRQILSGLKYLHDRNVVHRDIKCANILVDANGSVKLADFGLAKANKLNDVNSPYWMAPEVVKLRNRGYGLAADIWSLGCTVLEMLTRQPPYPHLEGVQALFRIGRGQPPPVPESLSTDARDFILKCLQVNPNKRPTAARLLDHLFVKRPLLSPISPVSPSINLLLS